MKKFFSKKKIAALSLSIAAMVAASATSFAAEPAKQWSEMKTADGYTLVKNPNGAELGYMEDSGVKILTVKGLAFKDLNRNGKLDIYEEILQNSYQSRILLD